ncbi:hypothetical protein HK101_011165 [Irineochytrium annulatum]|nr:hypothetical protein HK101_011165 [Irineochytrium annulatum]
MNPEHTKALEVAFAYGKELLAATDFTFHSNGTRKCVISMKDAPGGLLPITKGEITTTKYSRGDVMGVLQNLDVRPKWDDRFESGRILEEHGAGPRELGLTYTKQHGVWPVVSGRDFVLAFRVIVEGETTYFIQTSVKDERHPEVEGLVRGHLTIAMWCLRPAKGAEGGLEVTYIVQVDPAGTLPTYLGVYSALLISAF